MPKKPFELLAATTNPGKLLEIQTMMSVLPVSIFGLPSFAGVSEIEETGSSFLENASLKAAGYALQTGKWTLADDSGLQVEALGGAPGIYSARFGPANSDFDEKIRFLLQELDKSGSQNRSARFVAAVSFASPKGEIVYSTEGICRGSIAEKPFGKMGFGYDPIFIPDGFSQSFGQLPAELKNEMSHRARALRKFIRYLADFMGVSLDQTIFRL